MRSACTVLLALAAAALCSEPDPHRPRQDSNLEICILPPWVNAGERTAVHFCPFCPPRCVFLTSSLRQAAVWDQEERSAERTQEPGGAERHQSAVQDYRHHAQRAFQGRRVRVMAVIKGKWSVAFGLLHVAAFFLISVKKSPWAGGRGLMTMFRTQRSAARQSEWKACGPTHQLRWVGLNVHVAYECAGVPEDGYLHVLLKGNLHNQQKSFCQHFYACVCVGVCCPGFSHTSGLSFVGKNKQRYHLVLLHRCNLKVCEMEQLELKRAIWK